MFHPSAMSFSSYIWSGTRCLQRRVSTPSQKPMSKWRGSPRCQNLQSTANRDAHSLRTRLPAHQRTSHLQYQQLLQLFHTYEILSIHDLASTAYLLFTELVSFKFRVGCLLHSRILLFIRLLFNFLFLKTAKCLTIHDERPYSSLWILLFWEWPLTNFDYAKKIFFQKLSSRRDS